MNADIIWPLAATLGEGPLWIDAEQCLWFTDIKAQRLHRYDPATNAGTSIDLPGQTGFIAPCASGGLILGMGQALWHRAPDGTLSRVATFDTAPGNRINDGTTGPDGRLWFGTMDDAETHPTGAILRHDPDGRIEPVTAPCTITNGPAISADGRLIYHVDTLAGIIWRAAITPAGQLQGTQLFAQIAPEDGTPDGVTLDAEGGLWVGLWGGFALRRYAPSGAITATIRLPCANVTKLAFGGPDLKTAYITTARAGLSPADLAAQPLAGGLFRFRADIPGLPTPPALIEVPPCPTP